MVTKTMLMITMLPKKGYLLVAEPHLFSDVSFTKSVILLAEHTETGSIGFIVNKPLTYTINDLVPEINVQFTVFNGGPVEQDNLYFVHNVPHIINDSVEIYKGLFWGGNFDQLILALNDGKIQKENIRFFLGYSGWENKQLENEFEENAWIMMENNYNEALFSINSKKIWKEKIEELGGDYIYFSNAPENPALN